MQRMPRDPFRFETLDPRSSGSALAPCPCSSWPCQSAQDIEWADAMKAAERALNEARYDEAEESLRNPVRHAAKFKPRIGGSIEPSAL